MPKIRVGTRTTCDRCGQELEWNGTAWWDRGSDTCCGPYHGPDGEIVPERYTKKHKPMRREQ